MSELDTICADLVDHAGAIADEILEAWDEIGRAEPWLRVPSRAGHDHLPSLIRALAESAQCDRIIEEVHSEPIRIALRHGQTRRENGFDEELIFREYHLLRRALWNHIRIDYGDRNQAVEVILRIDAGITVVTGASLHGFHRDTLEARDQWAGITRRLLRNWPLPGGDAA